MDGGTEKRPVIALPVGDPNGIGPEIALMAATDPAVLAACVPVLIADPAVIHLTATRLGLQGELSVAVSDGRLLVKLVNSLDDGPEPGAVTAKAGAATVAYAREAIRMAEDGAAAAVVAGPHNETAVAKAGIPFSGYPGLLAEATGTEPDAVFLMLVTPRFRIVHATLHIGLRAALDSLAIEKVANAIRAADTALKRMGIAVPRIAVMGINPHAGEGGLFGEEDETITGPAVAAAREEGIAAEGPGGADLLLQENAHDAYIAMYHDQGHIPAKLEGRGAALGISIGAPVLFSTVAHGSAHDIAGTGSADPSAFKGALLKMAGILGSAPAAEAKGRIEANADRV